MRRFLLPWLLVGVWVSAQAQPQVYPRIETGTHTAKVNRIDVDAAGRFLFSASDDKTLRVWDLRTGKLLKILRPPIGPGEEGKLYAVAASPDGAAIAVGGFTGANGTDTPVYIFDRESGAIRKTIQGLADATNHLAYSKDGRYLAVAFGGKSGIRIYKVADYAEVARDAQYGDNCEWVEFDGSGRLLTVSYDGFIRLYSPDFRLLHKERPPGGANPWSARFSPDGKLIAVGFDDSMAVDVLSANDLSFLYTLKTPTQAGKEISSVLWSADGQTVCAAGTYQSGGARSVLCWDDAGRGKMNTFPVAGITLMDIRALHDGAIAFCVGDGSVGVLGPAGVIQWRVAPDPLDYRDPGSLRVSSDGGNVEVRPYFFNGTTWMMRHTIDFSVAEETLKIDSQPNVPLLPPVTSGLTIDDWQNTDHPTLDGHALPLQTYETSRSLAIAPNKDSFVLGSEWHIRKFDRQGKMAWNIPVAGVAWDVNISADRRFVIAALGDGTVRWYTFDKGEEVLALFVDRDLQRWVAWNPDGFFTFKGGGDSLIGYQINHGADQPGEFVKVDQLREAFYRADLIDQILKPDSAARVLVARNQVGDITQVLSSGLPPQIELVSSSQAEVADNYLLQFRVKDQGGGHSRIVYRIDGVEIEGRSVDIPGTGGDKISRSIPIGSGQHTLTVAAYSANGKVLGQPKTIQLIGRQIAPGSLPSLYLVAVGISHYSDNSLSDGVKFAAGDADEVAAKFREQKGKGLYRNVEAVSLEDARATVAGIQNTVAQEAKNVQPGDIFVLYLAGHGIAVDGDYYFIPWEAEYTNQEDLLKKSLNREAIQTLLKTIPTNKSVLLLDTCDSGAYLGGRLAPSSKAELEKIAIMSGRAVLAASNNDQMAMEGYQGHGVFTYALLEGLSAANSDAQGQISINGLAEYIQRRVPSITDEKWHYRQLPLSKIEGIPFPIAHKAGN